MTGKNPITLTPIAPGNRIQLPAEWMQSLGLNGVVALEKTYAGILVRPLPRTTWDDVLGIKLVVGSAPPYQHEDDAELTGDDFIF